MKPRTSVRLGPASPPMRRSRESSALKQHGSHPLEHVHCLPHLQDYVDDLILCSVICFATGPPNSESRKCGSGSESRVSNRTGRASLLVICVEMTDAILVSTSKENHPSLVNDGTGVSEMPFPRGRGRGRGRVSPPVLVLTAHQPNLRTAISA